MTTIPYVRYEGIPLQQIFGWVHDAAGARAVRPMEEGLGAVGKTFAESTDNIMSTMRSLGIAWQGTAASTAETTLATVTESSSAKGDGAEKAGNNTQGHGIDFERLRSQVAFQDPGEYSFWQRAWDAGWELPWGGQMFGIQSDYRDALEINEAAKGEAVRAMYVYEEQARSRVAMFPAAVDDPAFGAGGGLAGVGGLGGSGGGVGRLDSIPTVPHSGAGGGIPGGSSFSPPGGSAGGLSAPGAGSGGLGIPGGGSGQLAGGSGAPPISPTGNSPSIPAVPSPGASNSPSPGPGLAGVPLAPGMPFSGGTAMRGSSSSRPTLSKVPSTGRSFRADLLRSAEPTVSTPRGTPTRAGETAPHGSAPGRAGAGSTSSGMYPPMTAAAGRGGDRSHRARFTVPSSEPFEVDVPHVTPVIGGDE